MCLKRGVVLLKKLFITALFSLLVFGCTQPTTSPVVPSVSPTVDVLPSVTPLGDYPPALPSVDTSEIDAIDSQGLNELDSITTDLDGDIPTSDLEE